MPQDCYFFVDMDEAIDDSRRTLSVLCVSCRNAEHPDTGWFWEGSREGYGPWEYTCVHCGVDVSKEINGNQTETADQDSRG